jgi:phosphoribosylformimino-5-aminoimidazole carboxamide ribotide isomerase
LQIIPVIDLLDGVVVHAQRGDRAHYQPIQSQLTASSQPVEIVSALLALYPFTELYIADLNAIQKLTGATDTNYEAIKKIQSHFPQLTLWLDAGISSQAELTFWQSLNVRLILGSENFKEIQSYTALLHQLSNPILSLDIMPQGYQGPAELLMECDYWPEDVIVMSLAHVGANLGPNLALLTQTIERAKESHIIAAGGIRGIADLLHLKTMGVDGALVATALHKRQLSHAEIASIVT